MKMIKKALALTLTIILCCYALCACSNSPQKVLTSGKWKTESGWTYYRFYENGRYFYSVSWNGILMHEEEGDWIISGNLVKKDPDDADLDEVEYMIDTKEKTLTCVDDPDEVFFLD